MRKSEEEEPEPQRRLTTNQEYPEIVTWETLERNVYDPQTGELVSQPVDNTEIDSIEVLGKTSERPEAGQAKVGNLTLSNDFEGQLAEQVETRVRDTQEEAAYDAHLPSDPTRRQQLTSEGRYPDVIVWLARNRKTLNPRTGEFTSQMIDNTAVETVQVQGTTTEPPAETDARVGNLRVQADGQGASVEAVEKRAMSLPQTGLPKAEDLPGGARRKPGKRGRRSKGSKIPDEILTEMAGQGGAAQAPVIYIK